MPIYRHTSTFGIDAIVNRHIVTNSHYFRKCAITNRHIGSEFSTVHTNKNIEISPKTLAGTYGINFSFTP